MSVTKQRLVYMLLFVAFTLCFFFSIAPAHAADAVVDVAQGNWLEDTNWLVLASSIVGLFSVIATMTPNTADNRVADFLLRLINVLGANVGKAKNNEYIE